MSDLLIIGAAIVLKEKNGFLFELQKRAKWKHAPDGVLEAGMSCIGGTVEEGESLEDALQREAMEEIGCSVAVDRSTHPFSIDPEGNASPLPPGSVPAGVQFLWEGNDPGFVPGAKVAVYAGHAIGRAAPGDLSAIATLKPELFYELARESFTVERLEAQGGILKERVRVPRSARVKPVGTAARLLELQRRNPEFFQRILGVS
ncbi:MAG: NUDIX domain-containing protein [Candidatus Latescibacteria bacterium]|nr:NUDIX domain-containing protein [Candidatus Latescibacterota bacterium]